MIGWKTDSARSPPSSSDATSGILTRRNGDIGGQLPSTEKAPLRHGARNRTSAKADVAWQTPILHSCRSRDAPSNGDECDMATNRLGAPGIYSDSVAAHGLAANYLASESPMETQVW
jgi:hypothetical protein